MWKGYLKMHFHNHTRKKVQRMSEYQGCDICKHQKKSKREKPCLECTKNRAKNNFEPMTNADAIRNMTDEELAEFLCEYEACPLCPHQTDSMCNSKNCDEVGITLEWLQEEVENENKA
jgi:hypothetical protein